MEIKITLSRAHKVLERIAVAMNTYRNTAVGTDVKVMLRGPATDGQLALLSQRVEKVRAALAQQETLSATYEKLRKLIGNVNVKSGVSDLLAEIETNKRAIQMYEQLIGAYELSADFVHVSDAANIAWEPASVVARQAVYVTAAPAEWSTEFVQKRDELKRANFQLSDQLASLNAKTITFELEDELAKSLGL